MGARVVIVGGTGFIGAPTARRLVAAGHDVDVLHRARMTARFDPEVVIHFMLMNEGDAEAALVTWPRARIVAISSGDVYRAYGQLLGLEPRDAGDGHALLGEDAPLRQTLYPYGRRVDSPWGALVDYDKI